MMGEFANNYGVKTIAWIVACIIVGLNVKLVIDQLSEWIASSPEPVWIYVVVLPIVAGIFLLLAYVTLKPFIRFPRKEEIPAWKKLSHLIRSPEYDLDLEVPRYNRIGVAVAHTDNDKKVLSHALVLARQYNATLCLFHVVEGAGGVVFGRDAYDEEARQDEAYLERLANSLSHRGVDVEFFLGFGVVTKELVRLVQEQNIDILLMAGHGHRGISDILFGSTISPVRHGLEIPIIIVR
jgi:manganese transport protein